MICSETQSQLNFLIDGELLADEARSVRRHITSCAACQHELESIERLRAMLRANDIILEETQSTFQDGNTRPVSPSGLTFLTQRKKRILSVGLAAAALIFATSLTLVTETHPEKSLAAEVSDALARTNTWHLSGWRQINSKRVPWEIWGRRKPYLYYETVGGDSIYDDGKVQTRIYAPSNGQTAGMEIPTSAWRVTYGNIAATGNGNVPGMVILTQSNGGNFSNENEEPAWDDVVNPMSWQPGFNTLDTTKIQSIDGLAVFRRQFPEGISQGVNSNELFMVDPVKHLPVRYVLRYDNNRQSWDAEDMSATYDVNLPANAQQPVIPPGFEMVDMRPQPTPTPVTPTAQAEMSIGLTINTQALTVTKDGTILLGADAIPDASRLKIPSQGSFHFSVTPPMTLIVAGSDSQGPRSILYLDDFSNVSPGEFVMLSPVDTYPPRGWKPTSVTVPLTATVSIDVPHTDVLDVHGKQLGVGDTTTTIASETRTVRLELGNGNISSSLAPYVSKLFGPYEDASILHATRQIAESHSDYWMSVPDNPNVTSNWPQRLVKLLGTKPQDPELLRFETVMQERYRIVRNRDYVKAAGWMLRKADCTPKTGDIAFERIGDMGRAAICYREAGQEQLARQVWNRMLIAGRNNPDDAFFVQEAKLGLSGKRLVEEQ